MHVTFDANQERQQLFDELKDLLTVKYELDREPETGSVRSDLLRDGEEKKRMFADPDINELLQGIAELDPAMAQEVQNGESYEHVLTRILDAAINSAVEESEGLGTTDA